MANTTCAPVSSAGAVNELLQGWGRDIAAARQEMGLSQSSCAACLFLREETVRAVENGDQDVGLGAFTAVLWALGLLDHLEGPLPPIEVVEQRACLPVKIFDWQVSRLPVLFQTGEALTPDTEPAWPHELWALGECANGATGEAFRRGAPKDKETGAESSGQVPTYPEEPAGHSARDDRSFQPEWLQRRQEREDIKDEPSPDRSLNATNMGAGTWAATEPLRGRMMQATLQLLRKGHLALSK
ncbi:helix-turn-helix domain-containing protein [Roseibium polysiphoniae]|uniref:HTH cro/C1-type domain-containing protein n=1 Tax=Roseibium polysiphoniae TaxID=2571221 RepID=A0ABR9CET3_9HYPH|nr:hypothetical protein [Roseibium polysiphoniae]MBD8878397.1 hypothetical protein [Roseibium polysiphoniae]